jgi:acetate kinase
VAESLTLVVNPGSASRKYAIYANGYKWASINFEFVDGNVFGKIEHADQEYSKTYDDKDLSSVSRYVMPLLRERQVISDDDAITTIGLRLVAPSMRFMQDRLIDDEIEQELERVQLVAPLHITTALAELKQLRIAFEGVPVIAISDSAFHSTKHPWAWEYGIDKDLSDRIDVKRFGYHGISVSSVVRLLSEADMLGQKTVVCHLGSGSSVTAVLNGKSADNTMGYTPLEGLMMASRSGSMDISAALAIKRELKMSDEEIEQYLNKKGGLLGVSGSSNDIRQLLFSEENGDERAKLALQVFVYRIQQAIGQMAASIGGIDTLVFTGTVGERSIAMRGRIMDNLEYLGLKYSHERNEQTFEPKEPTNIADEGSKAIIIISTDEAAEIARRTVEYNN